MTDVTQNQDNTTATQNTASTPTQTGAANPGSNEAKLFTQAELEAKIQARVARAEEREAKVKAELLEQLGLPQAADFTALKSVIEKARTLEQASMTESQKLQAERDRLAKEKEDVLAQLNTERAQRRNDKIASALMTAARGLNANEKALDDVVRHAQDKHSEAFAALIDDQGNVDTDKAKALVEKIKAEKDHYFGKAGTGAVVATVIPSNSGGRPQDIHTDALRRASAVNQRLIRGG